MNDERAHLDVGAKLRQAGYYFLNFAIFSDITFAVPLVGEVTSAKLLVPLGIMLMLVGGISRLRLKLTTIAFFAAYGTYIVINVVSSSASHVASFSIVQSYVIGLALVFTISSIPQRDLERFVISFIYVALFSSILGVWQSVFGGPFFTERYFPSNVIGGVQLFRASGLFADPNYFALYTLVATPLAYRAWKQQGKAGLMWGVPLMVMSIVLSGSRAAAIVILLLVLGALLQDQRITRTWKTLGVLFTLFVSLASVPFLSDQYTAIFDPENYQWYSTRSSLTDRYLVLQIGLEVAKENMWLGYGLGQFRFHPYNIYGQVSHNTVVEIFSELGAFGLMFFTAFCWVLLNKLLKYSTNSLGRALLLSLVCYLSMSLFLVTHYSRITFWILGVVLLWDVVRSGRNSSMR